jgi:predicted nucleotidyltransferase
MNARAYLARVARAIGDLNERVVFVGGATVDIFVTDRAAGPARFTEDVDVIVRVGSRVEFHEQIETVLRARGFKPDMREDAPICRWVNADITLDVMPTDDSVLGFSNRWYEDGITQARIFDVADGVCIRVLSAPHFVATKLEAFKGRGKRDFLGSADIEDIVRLLDGRPELLSELGQCSDELREYLRQELAGLLGDDEFLEAVPGHLMGDAASQARVGVILERMSKMIAVE